jgi:lipopolysaccharide heptosyltransferase II
MRGSNSVLSSSKEAVLPVGDLRYPFKKSWRWGLVALVDRVLDLFTARNRKVIFPRAVRNVLVVRLDQLGDVICSLPVLSILKERFPNARITFLCGAEGQSILEGNPQVDEVITFRSNWFARGRSLDLDELYDVLSRLRDQKFDLGFDLRGDLRNVLAMTLAGVRYRAGYGIAGGAGLLHEAPDYDASAHQVILNRNLVTDKRQTQQDLKPQIYLSSSERAWADRALQGFRTDNTTLIAIHPEAGYSSKEWGAPKFISLIEQLLQQERVRVLVFGLDRAEMVACAFSSTHRVKSFVGKTSLRQMMALLSTCHLFIGNDSGPSHVAQALSVCSVIVASGTNEYEKWGLWRQPVTILRHAVSCAPCHLSTCPVEGHPCLSEISVEEVTGAVRSSLDRVAV